MRKGYKTSESTKLKQSLAKLGHIPWNKGMKTPIKVREKQSLSRRAFFKRANPDYSFEDKDVLSDDRKRVRRERIAKYGGLHSIGEWETLKAQYNWECPSCKKS